LSCTALSLCFVLCLVTVLVSGSRCFTFNTLPSRVTAPGL